MVKFVSETEKKGDVKRVYNKKGMKFRRIFTKKGQSVYDMFKWDKRHSKITNPNGSVVFEMKDAEVPSHWSQVATDIVVSKYFRKAGVPQYDSNGDPIKDKNGKQFLGPEKSVWQVVSRLVGTWRYWGERYGYFASEEDADAFEDEMKFMLLDQMAAPNSPQWFNTGLNWAYDINGPPQGHYYTDPETGETKKSEDAYTHPQPHACGRYNTKLFTEKGILELGRIVEENMKGIRVFDGEKFVKIQAVKNNGVKSVYRATLKNGNFIEFTDDHLIYTSFKRQKDGGVYKWTELKNILGMKVQQISLHYKRNNKTGNDLLIDKAALAGFVIGDGYYGKYNKNKKTTLFGVVTVNDDEFNFVTGLFEKIFGKYNIQTRKNINDLYRIVKLDSKIVDSFVKEYELNNTSYTVKVPSKIFEGTNSEKTAFLRSLFQADGSVRIRTDDGRNSGDIVLTSVSEELVHGVQQLLLELGIYSNITKNQDKRENRKDSYQLSISYYSERKKYEELIGFVSEDKKQKLKSLNEDINGKNKESLSEETVVSIDYVGEEEVYDIQTESGRFLANGVVVHNCFIQEIKDDLVGEGGIMDLWIREARLFKYGSGTGTNFSNIRAAGEPLSGGGVSSGVMSFLRIGDRAAGAIKSGGTTRRAAKMVILDIDHPDIEEFINWKKDEEKKAKILIEAGYDSDFNGEAYQTVSGQNSNNSVRVTNDFMRAVENDEEWGLIQRTTGNVAKTVKARDLWDQIAEAAWVCADPGLQYDTTINEWHTCPQSGRINASNPCSEYMFLDNTACNLASINLVKFYNENTKVFDVDSFKHAIRLWTFVLEISVLMAQFPSKEIAELSYKFRTLGLGYANIGSLLMRMGYPYDSEEGRNIAASITSILTGEAYATSAEMASFLGPFSEYELNKEDMLRVIRNHRHATYNDDMYEGLSIKPVGIDSNYTPKYLLDAAKNSWDKALELGNKYGYRNAQVSALAPTGTIGLLMDCDTTGIEPDFALVKFKKLAGGGYFKIVNQSVKPALKALGYTEQEIKDIIDYAVGKLSLEVDAPVNKNTLLDKGLSLEDIRRIEKILPSTFDLEHAFNTTTISEDTFSKLGYTKEQYESRDFSLLRELGFSDDEISKSNDIICGSLTVEGAPHLRKEHLAVFDCANKCGKKGKRYIDYMGHVKMMAATQPFITGAISKTINMPNEVTTDDIKKVYMDSWRLGLKAIAIYRDGSKMSQPLSSKKESKQEVKEKIVEKIVIKEVPRRRKLPDERQSITHKFRVGNHEGYITVGLFEDGTPGEIFITMSKEGSTLSGIMDAFATSISFNLQYGVPLEFLVDKFTHMRFEPSGFTSNKQIPMVKSLMDYIFRWLALKFLDKDKLSNFHTLVLDNQTTLIKPDKTEKIQKDEEGMNNFLGSIPKGDKPASLEATIDTKLNEVKQTSLTDHRAETDKKIVASTFSNSSDAPMCSTCGAVMVRNGSCYKCLECGETTGCS